ncbi:MarR family winged helix-turn-helix transcriptional regulator [Blastococcus sp. TF02A-26]|uniref:MarR family winged helix-turn-helix transcriptional regulator n=1 Tax=Blastococcus sp. TF02A-26 TaxID=2250577 RepID=UPI000DE8E14E|nr:MarR family winged helix-turn-helix transcriptional regulator [Blastococcus sp. TF02A-26]RBY79019.1 MarR family transcriptional regulator [Blastococcus sp. TF02A-26]
MDARPPAEPPLALLLLLASRWFDARSLAELEKRGWPRLSPAQSLVFVHVGATGTRPAELARRLGSTRQAAHELVNGLVRLDLIEVVDDPQRRGGRLVRPTPQGMRLARDAYAVLRELEDKTFGVRRSRTLRRLLADFDPGRPEAELTTPASPASTAS